MLRIWSNVIKYPYAAESHPVCLLADLGLRRAISQTLHTERDSSARLRILDGDKPIIYNNLYASNESC